MATLLAAGDVKALEKLRALQQKTTQDESYGKEQGSRRVVSKETFLEAVQENMEEFGMTRDEAVQDAITQFQAQGWSCPDLS